MQTICHHWQPFPGLHLPVCLLQILQVNAFRRLNLQHVKQWAEKLSTDTEAIIVHGGVDVCCRVKPCWPLHVGVQLSIV